MTFLLATISLTSSVADVMNRRVLIEDGTGSKRVY
jgi:hypothetical protein